MVSGASLETSLLFFYIKMVQQKYAKKSRLSPDKRTVGEKEARDGHDIPKQGSLHQLLIIRMKNQMII